MRLQERRAEVPFTDFLQNLPCHSGVERRARTTHTALEPRI